MEQEREKEKEKEHKGDETTSLESWRNHPRNWVASTEAVEEIKFSPMEEGEAPVTSENKVLKLSSYEDVKQLWKRRYREFTALQEQLGIPPADRPKDNIRLVWESLKKASKFQTTEQIFIEALERYNRLKVPLRACFEKAYKLGKEIESECVNKIEEGMDSLEDTSCCVIVVGDVSSGKSILLNTILQDDIMPSVATKCTPAIVEIRAGPWKLSLFSALGDTVPTLVLDVPQDKAERDKFMNTYLNLLGIAGAKDIPKFDKAVLEMDCPLLRVPLLSCAFSCFFFFFFLC